MYSNKDPFYGMFLASYRSTTQREKTAHGSNLKAVFLDLNRGNIP